MNHPLMRYMKLVVRAIAYFTPRFKDVNELKLRLEKAVTLLSDITKLVENEGFTVFTTRITLPQSEIGLADLVKTLDHLGLVEEGILVSIGSLNVDKAGEKAVAETVLGGYYTSLIFNEGNPVESSRVFSKIIHGVSDADPSAATRIAVGFHDQPIETPYFPDSTSSGVEGVGFSFLYPDYLRDAVNEGASIGEAFNMFSRSAASLFDAVKRAFRLRVVADFSLSPWKENSVVKLLEALGYRVLEPGFHYGLFELNKHIRMVAEASGAGVGFNEVMLPYAEDDELIKLGSKGVLTAYDLLSYTSICVAGPDMLAVPWSTEELSRFILDSYGVAATKKRPMALRVIPVNSEPLEAVDLGRFGKVPVIPYSRREPRLSKR